MPTLAVLFGFILVAVGLEGYTNTLNLFAVEQLHSPTALIPAYFGAALIVCGLVASNAAARKHAMHAAAMVALLGTLGGLGMGLAKLPKLMDGTAERPSAVKLQLAMGVVSLVFLGLCIKSFVDAQARRNQGVTG